MDGEGQAGVGPREAGLKDAVLAARDAEQEQEGQREKLAKKMDLARARGWSTVENYVSAWVDHEARFLQPAKQAYTAARDAVGSPTGCMPPDHSTAWEPGVVLSGLTGRGVVQLTEYFESNPNPEGRVDTVDGWLKDQDGSGTQEADAAAGETGDAPPTTVVLSTDTATGIRPRPRHRLHLMPV